MKKTLRLFALLFVCLLAFSALVACGDEPSSGPTPELDFDKAKSNLEKNEYQLTFAVKQGDAEDEHYFEILAGEFGSRDNVHTGNFIPAVSPSDIEAALEIDAYLPAGVDTYNLKIVWFKSDNAAKKYYDAMKSSIDNEKKEMKLVISSIKEELKNVSGEEKSELEDELALAQKYVDEYFCGISGKVVWRGFADEIEATK